MAQRISGMRVDIFGTVLANSFQDVKEAGKLHAQNEDGKRIESSPANLWGSLL